MVRVVDADYTGDLRGSVVIDYLRHIWTWMSYGLNWELPFVAEMM